MGSPRHATYVLCVLRGQATKKKGGYDMGKLYSTARCILVITCTGIVGEKGITSCGYVWIRTRLHVAVGGQVWVSSVMTTDVLLVAM